MFSAFFSVFELRCERSAFACRQNIGTRVLTPVNSKSYLISSCHTMLSPLLFGVLCRRLQAHMHTATNILKCSHESAVTQTNVCIVSFCFCYFCCQFFYCGFLHFRNFFFFCLFAFCVVFHFNMPRRAFRRKHFCCQFCCNFCCTRIITTSFLITVFQYGA